MSFRTPFGYGGDAPQFQSQIWIHQNEHEALSDIEYRAFKKPRVSELAPSTKMPVAVNRELKCRFIKTQLCEKFNLGMCPYGDNCNYAHGIQEIRMWAHQCHEVVAKEGHFDKNWNGERNISKCRMFHNGGTCTYGDRCRFLHDVPKKHREDSDARIVNPKPVIYKTRLCTKWEVTGGCRFGKTCCFAHGQAELQNSGYHAAAESKNVNCKTVVGPRVGRSSSAVLVTPVREQVSGVKCIFKWRVLGKIDGIYADWIDDVPAVTRA